MQGKQAKIVSPTQERAILGYLVTTRYPARDRVMFLLSMKAGLRAKAMASLTWAMVTNAAGHVAEVLHVPNRASKGKTGGRTISLHPDLQAALVTLQAERGAMASPERSILFSERGGGLSPATVRLWFHRLSTSLKMDGCSSHSGRRTFITRAVRKVSQVGGSLRDVQELAGHTSLAMTQRDIEGETEAKRKLVALLYDGGWMARRVEKRTRVQASATRASSGSWVQGLGHKPPGRAARPMPTPAADARVGGMGQSPETPTESLGSAHSARDHAQTSRGFVPGSPWAILSRLHVSLRSSSGEGSFRLLLCDTHVQHGRT